MSDVRTLREKFLARTEQIRVRIPIDPDAAADLADAQQERARIINEHNKLLKASEDGTARRRLTDPDVPAEPNTTVVDDWIEHAEARVDESSIIIVLQWKPKAYGEIMKRAGIDGSTALEVAEQMAEAYYVRAEVLDSDTWMDMALSWEQVSQRLSEGEMLQLGNQAQALATASDAAPFVKRSRSSGKD